MQTVVVEMQKLEQTSMRRTHGVLARDGAGTMMAAIRDSSPCTLHASGLDVIELGAAH